MKKIVLQEIKEKVRNNWKKNHLPLIQDLGMCPFFIIMRCCGILGKFFVHLQKFMRILLRVWIAWLARQKTQYEHQSQKQNNILWFWFSSQPYSLCSNFFLDVGCLLTCLPYSLLFALWCNLNNLWVTKILSVAHSYCFLKCLYIVVICQLITAIADQCQAKKIFEKNLFYLSYLSYFFQDMKPEPHSVSTALVVWNPGPCRDFNISQMLKTRSKILFGCQSSISSDFYSRN